MIRRTHNDEQARFCGLFYWANEIDLRPGQKGGAKQ